MSDEYLTIAQAAAKFKVSKSLLQTRCREGVLPAARVGKGYRIRSADLELWVNRTPPNTKAAVVSTDNNLLGCIAEWTLHMTAIGGLSPETVRTHITSLRIYMKRLNKYHQGCDGFDRMFDRVGFTKVIASFPAKSFSSKINTYCAVLKFGKYLIADGVLPPSTLDRLIPLKPKRLSEPNRVSIKADQVPRLFDHLLSRKAAPYDNLMLAAFVACMLYAGLRVSEACNLTRDDVDLVDGTIYIRRGKGGKSRTVGITSALRVRLLDYLTVRHKSEQFFNQSNGQGLTRTSMAQRMIKISSQTGFHVTCHGLRRTFATLAAAQGRSVNSIRIALGHSKLDTTQAYLRTSEAEVVEAMKNW